MKVSLFCVLYFISPSLSLRVLLASLRTSKELRGQVLSHGKFGVFVAVRPSEEANVTVGLLPKVRGGKTATISGCFPFGLKRGGKNYGRIVTN